jgi:hypothetical protein
MGDRCNGNEIFLGNYEERGTIIRRGMDVDIKICI